jgi:hypothetical protein
MVSKSRGGSPKNSWQERSVAAMAAWRNEATLFGMVWSGGMQSKVEGRGVEGRTVRDGRPAGGWIFSTFDRRPSTQRHEAG